VELQDHLDGFERNGIQVYAISYDPVETLAKFAERFHITYPLLSDPDSATIRKFGILNANMPEGHPWRGVPYPGTFMVDEQGRVIERSFYANHAVRDSVARMLQETFRVADAQRGEVQTVKASPLSVTAYLSSGTVRGGQVLTFTVEVEIEQGWHIYGRPLPEGYVPTTLTFEEVEGVAFGEVDYPAPRPYRFEALGETLHAYEGRIVLKASVLNRRREGFVVKAHLRYQACDDRECLPPQEMGVELPLKYLDNVK